MRPASGRSSTARHWSVSVLPAPDGPNSAATPATDGHATSSVNPGNRLTSVTSSGMSGRAGAETAGHDQDDAREQGQEADQDKGAAGLPDLDSGIDREGNGGRAPRDVAGEHQRRAELPERPGEGQHEPGQDAVASERERHLERGAPLGTPERVRGPLEIPVNGLDRGASRADRKSTRLNSSHLGISYAVF